MEIYIDGQYYVQDEAKISVFDHGLLYGDGVFEGIRSYNGRVFKLNEHLESLLIIILIINFLEMHNIGMPKHLELDSFIQMLLQHI